MRITPIVLLLAAVRAAADPAPTTPAFWLDRAARDVAAARDVVEYDGPFPRVTAYQVAADLYRADPTPARRKLLEDKFAAGETQLEAATQPWRRWYGRLQLARVAGADLKDDAAYRRHLAAADALAPYLPDRAKNAPLYRRIRGTELAAAGDADALRKECAAAAKTSADQLEWYGNVADRCLALGLDGGARAALDQLAADASVLPAGPDRAMADYLLASQYARLGDYDTVLKALPNLNGLATFDVARRVFRHARRDGRADVIGKVRDVLADAHVPTAGAFGGDYVAELAAAAGPKAALDVARDILRRGATTEAEFFDASLAAGLAAAGEKAASAELASRARRATDRSQDPLVRGGVALVLAAAYARTGGWDAMTRAADDATKVAGVTEKELAPHRARLIQTLLDLHRWDDALRQLAPIRAKPDRDAWMPQIVAAQVRAGATDLAAANARTMEGFVRARCWRRIAIERAKRNDLTNLPAWVDEIDTPLRRAATDLAIAQVLAHEPIRAAGFPPDED